MLRPYVCVLCEKVIIAQDGVPSLIGLFTKMTATVAIEADEIPKNAVVPKEWTVYSSWIPEPGDEAREYFHCVQVLYPDQSQFAEVSKNKIPVEANKRAQMYVQMLGFPIGQRGYYTVRVWIEEKGERVLGPIDLNLELEVIRQKLPLAI